MSSLRVALSEIIQQQVNELTANDSKILHHGIVSPGALLYMPPGWLVVETCVNSSLPHGCDFVNSMPPLAPLMPFGRLQQAHDR